MLFSCYFLHYLIDAGNIFFWLFVLCCSIYCVIFCKKIPLSRHVVYVMDGWFIGPVRDVHRGYYTVARRYEFYVWVARTISHEWAKWMSEILFLPREHEIHIFEPMCNVLFIIWRNNKRDTRNQFNKSKRRESWCHWMIRHSQRWHAENTHSGPGWSGVWNLWVV